MFRVNREELANIRSQFATTYLQLPDNKEELEQEATCKDFLQVQIEGGREIRRVAKFYNLDVIISVGYRVKSKRGTLANAFSPLRKWIPRRLKRSKPDYNKSNEYKLTFLFN